VARLAQILDLIRRLQKATFYALHRQAREGGPVDGVDGVGPQAIADLMGEGRRAFHALGRKGFDEAGLADAARVEGFRQGATVLAAAADQILRYLEAIRRFGGSLDERFAADRDLFSRQFALLYGDDR
jgi:hypothetical protein